MLQAFLKREWLSVLVRGGVVNVARGVPVLLVRRLSFGTETLLFLFLEEHLRNGVRIHPPNLKRLGEVVVAALLCKHFANMRLDPQFLRVLQHRLVTLVLSLHH